MYLPETIWPWKTSVVWPWKTSVLPLSDIQCNIRLMLSSLTKKIMNFYLGYLAKENCNKNWISLLWIALNIQFWKQTTKAFSKREIQTSKKYRFIRLKSLKSLSFPWQNCTSKWIQTVKKNVFNFFNNFFLQQQIF